MNDEVKRSRMSMHLERNTLSFILFVTRIGQAFHTATLLHMYIDIKDYIEEVSQLSLPVKPIKTEMAYVEKMLDFYCLRYQKQDAVRLQVTGRYSGQIVPALVLLTITENVGTYADLTRADAVCIELLRSSVPDFDKNILQYIFGYSVNFYEASNPFIEELAVPIIKNIIGIGISIFEFYQEFSFSIRSQSRVS